MGCHGDRTFSYNPNRFIFEDIFVSHSGDPNEQLVNNIGITHGFSCINICRVPRKLFEHEAARPSVQTSSEGPGKC